MEDLSAFMAIMRKRDGVGVIQGPSAFSARLMRSS